MYICDRLVLNLPPEIKPWNVVRQFGETLKTIENMKKLLLLILLFSLKIYSQEILTKDEIFSKDSLVYKVSNSELVTGKIQRFKRKTHLTFELEFENGELKKSIQYYNGKALKISEEIFYRKYGKIEKKIRYGYSRDYKWYEYYDDDNKKVLEEEYENGLLVYSCPYSNNKKNGIVMSINENGQKTECIFVDGKQIK